MTERYTTGKQPCQNFDPEIEVDEHAFWPNVHQCYRCEGTVSFCITCCKDHHSGGYETCVAQSQKREGG